MQQNDRPKSPVPEGHGGSRARRGHACREAGAVVKQALQRETCTTPPGRPGGTRLLAKGGGGSSCGDSRCDRGPLGTPCQTFTKRREPRVFCVHMPGLRAPGAPPPAPASAVPRRSPRAAAPVAKASRPASPRRPDPCSPLSPAAKSESAGHCVSAARSSPSPRRAGCRESQG